MTLGVAEFQELHGKTEVSMCFVVGSCEPRKLGAWRGMSPDLDPCCGGDGVASADLASLQVLIS